MRLKVPYKIADKVADRVADKMDKMSAKTNVLKQAGGGVTQYTTPEKFEIEEWEPSMLAGLKEAYKAEHAKDYSFEDFLRRMLSEDSNALGPAAEQDLTHPLSNYFISTSHNTYLTGHQLYGRANVEGYRNVLLRGCRSVEIDVWDGEEPSSPGSKDEGKEDASHDPQKLSEGHHIERVEPVVLHGYTATRDISFRKVCETIRDNAFVTSKLPVIVSLEVHTSREQQEMMVDIMEETFKGHLIDPEKGDTADEKTLPSPVELAEKILIKVKYSPPGPKPEDEPIEKLTKVSSETSRSSRSEIPDEEKQAKPNKIIAALSRLGIYTRSYHFKGLEAPEATVPTHVFSLSEGTLSEVHKTNPKGLFNHNKNFLMRAYPKGTRISSSNLDPAPFWRQGVQMVALNWQRIDAGVMLNEAMFANTGGWVLKPAGYRSNADYSGEFGGHGSNFTVQFIAGQDISPPEGINAGDLRPYVKCELHFEIPNEWETLAEKEEKQKDGEFKEQIKSSKGIHPDFHGQTVQFTNLPSVVPELGFVRFKVMHNKAMARDPLAAWACIRLDRLRPGYKFIHLFDAKGVQTRGFILANFSFEWQLKARIVPKAKPSFTAPSGSSQITGLPLR